MSNEFNQNTSSDSELKTAESSLPFTYYVVAPRKLIILFIVTIGMYAIYWFYKNWQNFKLETNRPMWPVMRGIFSIFFAHSLFKEVNNTLVTKKITYNWDYSYLATVYVIAQVIGNICDRLSYKNVGSPYTDLISFILLPVICWSLYKSQLAINLACEDPNGESNSKLTGANYVWITLGVILILLILIGLYITITEIPQVS